jgi:hypothetical protein
MYQRKSMILESCVEEGGTRGKKLVVRREEQHNEPKEREP